MSDQAINAPDIEDLLVRVEADFARRQPHDSGWASTPGKMLYKPLD